MHFRKLNGLLKAPPLSQKINRFGVADRYDYISKNWGG
jgi:hypothetical protein